ncbi:hypothetical protein ACFE04_017514 [Oxalis oulophora]
MERAYFTATIIDTPQWPTRNHHSIEYLVQYNNLLSNDGAKYLTEFVDLSLIRSLPPSRDYNHFELNDVVDVFHFKGWRVCVIDKVMCKEEGKEYRVRFDQNPNSHFFDFAHDFLSLIGLEPSFGPRIVNVTRGSLRRMKKADGNGQCFANSRKSPSEKSDVYTKETSLDVAFPSKVQCDEVTPKKCSKKLKIVVNQISCSFPFKCVIL